MTLTAAVLLLAMTPAIAPARVTRARFLMGTVCEITAGNVAEIDAAFDEAKRVEAMLSTWRDDSELSRVNRGETASPELLSLLRRVAAISDETGGAFSLLVRPLLDAWKIRSDGAVPDAESLRTATRRARPENLALADGVALRDGAQIEEGGFGKGYALDRMLAILHGDAVINFGGQIAVRGTTRAAIAHPLHRDHAALEVTLHDESLSTSSGSEKSFVAGGRHFSHIVDPRSGEALPPRGSVSVIHPSALVADALSTALYVMGTCEGLRWAREHRVRAIFISESGEVTQ
jgi:thiamine biosynthesis lipoprotein